jgi:hypothetical protein
LLRDASRSNGEIWDQKARDFTSKGMLRDASRSN